MCRFQKRCVDSKKRPPKILSKLKKINLTAAKRQIKETTHLGDDSTFLCTRWKINPQNRPVDRNLSARWNPIIDLQKRPSYRVSETRWRRHLECLVFVGRFSKTSPVISGSFAENDLQLKTSYGYSLPCTYMRGVSIHHTDAKDLQKILLETIMKETYERDL